MRYIVREGLEASVVGFGCGAVLGRVGRKESLRAMGEAWSIGVNVFDTARSYGYGEGEGLLGEFLQGRRENAVIFTKFGIWPERQQRWKQAAKPLVRGLLKLVPGARGLVRRGAASQMTANQFTVPILRASLEESLRRLRTDYVDVLFVHAAPASVLQQDDLMAELERVVAEGKARRAGISCEPEVASVALERRLPVLQAFEFPANLFNLNVTAPISAREANAPLLVANHPFGGLARVAESLQRIDTLAKSEATPAELQAKLQDGLKEKSNLLLADVVLNTILRGVGIDMIVPAMMNRSNLHANVNAISTSRFTDAEVAILREEFQGTAVRA